MERSVFIYHCNQHVSLFGDHHSKQARKHMGINSFTCAVDLIELDFLLSFTETLISTVRRGERLPITIGVALCHVDDCYNKKVGAKLATERMAPEMAQITHLEITSLIEKRWSMRVEFSFPEMGLIMKVKQDDIHRRPAVSVEWEVR